MSSFLRPLFICAIFLIAGCGNAHREQLDIASGKYVKKDYRGAVAICTNELKSLTKQDSLYTKFTELRAVAYSAWHNYPAAIADTKTLIQLHPRITAYYTSMAFFYGEQGDMATAFQYLKKGYTLDPNDPELLNNLAYYSGQVHQFAECVMYANKGLEKADRSQLKGMLLNNRGYGHYGLKEYGPALADINEALTLWPDNSYAYYFRVLINIATNNMTTVCDDLHKADGLGGNEDKVAELIARYCK